MKRKFLFFIGFIFSIIIFISCSKYSVYHLNEDVTSKMSNGIIYNLPQTAFIVEIDVEKSIKIKGPYAEFAEKLLGLKNVIPFNQTAFDIQNIGIKTMLIPDTSQYYIIKSKSGCKKNRHRFSNSFFMGDNLNLIAMNKSIEYEAPDNDVFQIKTTSQNYPNLFKLYADASQIEKIDTVYETFKLDTVVMSKPVIKRTLITKTPLQRAEEAADYILKFRLKRFELMSAYQEVAYSKEAFEFLTSELEKTENQYLNLFTGITMTEITKYQFLVIPKHENKNSSIKMFGFSINRGITDTTDEQSEIYSLNFNSLAQSSAIDTLLTKSIKKTTKNGLFYRIPESNRISVSVSGDIIPQYYYMPILQFGSIHSLPSSIKSIVLDKKTGNINYIRNR